jgi:hypothetical protein
MVAAGAHRFTAAKIPVQDVRQIRHGPREPIDLVQINTITLAEAAQAFF